MTFFRRLAVAGSVLTAGAAASGAVRAGFAERDISPTVGMREAHAVARHVFKVFVDPCKVRAAVFDVQRLAYEESSLAAQLRPDAAPDHPRLAAPGRPWPHGRVDPQIR